MARIIVFDTETTGFNYAGGDRIIEIGAVEILDGKITDSTFHEYINPDGRVIPAEAYMVHKLSNDFLSDKPKMAEVAPRFLEFVGDSEVVAHNGFDFDFPFINYELQQLGLSIIPRERQKDTIVLARHKVFGPKEFSLDSLAKWFGISLATRANAHGALIDSEILAKVYLEIENVESQKSISEIIAEQEIAFQAHPKIGANFPKRTFQVNETELAAHEELMKKIRKE